MNQELLNNYTVRITQANKSDLVVITYEIVLDSVKSAIAACTQEDFIAFEKDVKRIQKLLNELTGSLDFRFELSYQLLRLYQFAGEITASALFGKNTDNFDCLISIFDKLKVAFEEVAKQDTGSKVMLNTQSVYAGLTYGKNSLNEVCMDKNRNDRGFRA